MPYGVRVSLVDFHARHVADQIRLLTPLARSTNVIFQINAEVLATSRLVSVVSPSHNTTTVQSGYQGHYKALASIAQTDGSPLTEDWVLQVGLAQRHAPVAKVQKYNDSYVTMVALHPEMDEEQVNSEIIFVVDRSGSMAGSKMNSGTNITINTHIYY